MATKAEIQKVWGVLSLSYPGYGKDADPAALQATLGIYVQILADIPGNVLETAAMQHIATCKWFPTVAELRTLAVSLTQPALSGRTAMDAWGEVRKAAHEYYPYADVARGPEIADPIARKVVRDMGGLHYLSTSDNEMADRARFMEAYEAYKRRASEERLLLPQARELQALAGDNAAGQLPAPGESTVSAPKPVLSLIEAVANKRRMSDDKDDKQVRK